MRTLEITVRGSWKSSDTKITLHNETDDGVDILSEGFCSVGITRVQLIPRSAREMPAEPKGAEESTGAQNAPQSCYPGAVATLREMLNAECERADHIDEQIDKYGAEPDLMRRRHECARRVDALTTALEALGGVL